MKKTNLFLSVIALMLFSTIAFGQTQPPNGDFEAWTSGKADGWTSSVNIIMEINFLTQSTTFHDGQYAAQITTQSVFNNTVPGICTYGDINVDMGAMSAKIVGGKAFTERPTALTGWYQYTPAGPDSMIVYCLLTKFNQVSGVSDTVGGAFFITTAANTNYEQFNAVFEYKDGINPDTMNVIILSSGFSGVANSAVIIDELKFNYNGVGVDENSSNDFYIYPNPSNGVFNINLAKKESTRFTVYNSLGQMVYQTTSNDVVNTIDLSNCNKGIYLLEINNGKSTQSRKLVVK